MKKMRETIPMILSYGTFWEYEADLCIHVNLQLSIFILQPELLLRIAAVSWLMFSSPPLDFCILVFELMSYWYILISEFSRGV